MLAVSNDVYKFAENLSIMSIMRNLFLQLFVLLSISSYAATFEMDTVYYDRNGKGVSNPHFASYYKIVENNPADGNKRYRDYYVTGELKSEGNYLEIDRTDDSKTVRDADYVDYYRNGAVEEKGTFAGGKRQGEYVSYAEDGTVLIKANYQDDLLHGEYTKYADSGLSLRQTYSRGEPKYDYYELLGSDGRYSKVRTADDSPLYVSPSSDDRKTEYRDGQEWSYYNNDGLYVAVSNQEANDYGKYYRIYLNLTNNSFYPIEFDPTESMAMLTDDRGEAVTLNIQSSKQYQKRIKREQNWAEVLFVFLSGVCNGISAYCNDDGTANDELVAQQRSEEFIRNMRELSAAADGDRASRKKDYLKRTTIKPGETVEGYFNIKRKKGAFLTLNLMIGNAVYQFSWTLPLPKD